MEHCRWWEREREGEVSVPSFEILPSVVSCGSSMLLHTRWRCSFATPWFFTEVSRSQHRRVAKTP